MKVFSFWPATMGDTGIGVEVPDDFANNTIEQAIALYPYNGEYGDSSIAMKGGEEFIVIEEGDEDGWTKVRRKSRNTNSAELEGFVPTAYLQCL